jgi:hypothetical protein
MEVGKNTVDMNDQHLIVGQVKIRGLLNCRPYKVRETAFVIGGGGDEGGGGREG